ncbi:MAG: toll/interleukin-1 receptor domain-containing protein [Sedimentisphaerales bacterium]|nr:toll/interleukin-1 receptor domain-containing protein [Sedimentisphaerales bacterium]
MPEYKHQIFLSYRRSDKKWVSWTNDIFAVTLETLLRPALGNVSIFKDTVIETGRSWPSGLASALARSRIMLAVLSRDYFYSDWCRLEMSLMFHREKLVGFRTINNPSRLIIPVIIDDGDCFPREVQEMNCESMHDFANPFILKDTEKHTDMAEFLRKKVCPVIEKALSEVPDYDSSWNDITHKQIEHLFEIQAKTQKTLPSISLPEIP